MASSQIQLPTEVLDAIKNATSEKPKAAAAAHHHDAITQNVVRVWSELVKVENVKWRLGMGKGKIIFRDCVLLRDIPGTPFVAGTSVHGVTLVFGEKPWVAEIKETKRSDPVIVTYSVAWTIPQAAADA